MATRTAGGGGASYFNYGAAIANGLSAITVVLFVKSDSLNSDRGFFHTINPPNGNDDGVSLRYDTTGIGPTVNGLKGAINTTAGGAQLESSSNAQSTDFQSLIMRWASGTAWELWIDGAEDTPLTAPASRSGTTSGQNAVQMHRGAKDNTNAWNGVVYELAIYNRNLTDNEIRTIATRSSVAGIHDGIILHWHGEGAPGTSAGNIPDRSGNGYTGTVTGVTPTYEEDDRVTVRRRRAA